MKLFLILISAVFVNNFVLSQFLGICSFLGVSKKMDSAVGMSLAVTFVMTLASVIAHIVYHFMLKPNHLEYLSTIAFILSIAAIVQFVEMVIKKKSPSLYKALGIYLPLITTNCAVLGVALLNVKANYSLGESVVNGLGAGLGYTLALILLSSIREKIDNNDKILPALKGLPITLIMAGLMSISFLGFKGIVH